jgi:hypothetical protein
VAWVVRVWVCGGWVVSDAGMGGLLMDQVLAHEWGTRYGAPGASDLYPTHRKGAMDGPPGRRCRMRAG